MDLMGDPRPLVLADQDRVASQSVGQPSSTLELAALADRISVEAVELLGRDDELGERGGRSAQAIGAPPPLPDLPGQSSCRRSRRRTAPD